MLNLHTAIGVLALAIFTLAGATPAAAIWPRGTYQYAIEHEDHGRIGTHTVTFEEQGRDLVVKVRDRIRVRVLFWEYRFEADQKEVWRDGRLVAYDSNTNDDGKLITVLARADGDKLVIDGPTGRIEAPSTIFPTHPWNPKFVEQRLLMHTKTGELKNVEIKAAGLETIQAGVKRIKARKYRMTGDMKQELWFDENGVCVQLRFTRNGHTLTFALRQSIEAALS